MGRLTEAEIASHLSDKFGLPPEGAEWLVKAIRRCVPDDVRELVIAARIVAFEDQSPEALKRLDAASEAFADRVQWDESPDPLDNSALAGGADE